MKWDDIQKPAAWLSAMISRLIPRLFYAFHACYAPCITAGGVCGLVVYVVLDKDPSYGFALGFAILVYPTKSKMNDPKAMEKQMAQVRKWQQMGYLTEGDAEQFNREVLAKYKAIVVGVPPSTHFDSDEPKT